MWLLDGLHKERRHPHRVELRLGNIQQFFNSMDPSPFYLKDLDEDAEEYILSWAEEFPLKEPVRLVLHLDEGRSDGRFDAMVADAVHNHFGNLARLSRLEFRRLMRAGSRSLVIGLTVLALCLSAGEFVSRYSGPFYDVLRQSLLIGGWVAMWQPMQTYLYGWWPLRRRRQVYEKLSRMPVEIKAGTPRHDGSHAAASRG